MSVKYLKNLGIVISLAFLFCVGGLFVLSPTVAAPLPRLDQDAPTAPTKYNPVITITYPNAGDILTLSSQVITITYQESETITIGENELGISFSGEEGPYYTTTRVLTDTSIGDMWARVYTYDWALPEEDYVSHTLVARARNGRGQEAFSDPRIVYVDRIAPRAWISVPTAVIQTPAFSVTWGAEDGAPDVRYDVHYRIDQQGTWQEWLTSTPMTQETFVVTPQTMLAQRHLYTFRVRAWDTGLNASAWVSDDVAVGLSKIFLPLVVRNYPPHIKDAEVIINQRAKYTYDQQVDLTFEATAVGDTIQEIRVKNDVDTTWETYSWPQTGTLPLSWTLEDRTRLQTVAVQFVGSCVSETVTSQIYLVSNGGFEDDMAAWTSEAAPLPVQVTQSTVGHPGSSTPAEGRNALLLGNPGYPCGANGVPLGHASAQHSFEIPGAAQNPKLVFKYIIWTQDKSTSIQYDRFEVYVNGQAEPIFTDGNQNAGLDCDKWWRVPSPQNPRNGVTSGWATKTIDLRGYAGQEITVSFENHSRYDGWYNTYTYIDNVHITGGW